jgi:hypothetical protein
LETPGVELINRALMALVDGEDPTLILTLDGSVSPAPSPSNPLEFKWLACVTFQAVIDMDLYND